MNPKQPTPHSAQRGDFLVSVAVVGLAWTPRQIMALQQLARDLGGGYQFWEIVIVAPIIEELEPRVSSALGGISNVRLLRVGEVDNFYRLRLAAAAEAIGDVVVLTSGDELELMNVVVLANQVYESNDVIVMARGRQGFLATAFVAALGYLIDYRIDPRDTLTAGFPRSWLDPVIARPDADLLLRFERRRSATYFRREPVPDRAEVPRALRSIGRRFRLLADLLASAAPRVLRSVAALSFVLSIFAGLYGVYAIAVWLLKTDVAPGWLTTSMLQVVIVGFLGVTVSAISIGIVKLLDRIEGMLRYTIVDELNNMDFFSKVKDLNVEMRNREVAERR